MFNIVLATCSVQQMCPLKGSTAGTKVEDEKYWRLQRNGRMLLLDAKCPQRTNQLKTIIAGMRKNKTTEVKANNSLILRFDSEHLGTAKANNI